MQTVGTPSRRLAIGDGDAAEQLMLFVRDAAGLRVPPDPTVPPPLLGVDPRKPVGDVSQRSAAGAQWLAWWDDALSLEIARHRHEGRDSD